MKFLAFIIAAGLAGALFVLNEKFQDWWKNR